MPKVNKNLKLESLAEFCGTYVLVLTVGCVAFSGNYVWGGVAIACVLMIMVYCFGPLFGVSLNPAVCLALYVLYKQTHVGVDGEETCWYIAAQLLAGLAAGATYSLIFWDNFALAPPKNHGMVAVGLAEFLYTFVLVFVVLNTAAAADKKNTYYGLAIGFVIVAAGYGAGAISGACLNPAVALGIDTVAFRFGWGMSLFYSAFEFLGGLFAVGLFRAVRPEDFGGDRGVFQEMLSEFIGTFVLVLTVGLNVCAQSAAGAFSIAASLMCMIYALGDISGANFNPAVTIALLLSKEGGMTVPKAVRYVVAQVCGALCAAACYRGMFCGFALGPQKDHGLGAVAMAEMVFTFVLCYVVLSVAVSKWTSSKEMFGLAIGSCVTVGGNAIGGISGGSLNPAVSFGLAMGGLGEGQIWYMPFYYTLFELLGAALAAGTYAITHQVSWAVDQSYMVDKADLEQESGNVMVLDTHENSISKAVEFLNQELIDCPDGFCAAYSDRNQGFYILYDSAHEAAAMKLIPPLQ
jgi:aquaporin Z